MPMVQHIRCAGRLRSPCVVHCHGDEWKYLNQGPKVVRVMVRVQDSQCFPIGRVEDGERLVGAVEN